MVLSSKILLLSSVFLGGCSLTEIEFPMPTSEGVATAKYRSNRDSALEDLHLEVAPDGTVYVTLGSASGRATDVTRAYTQAIADLAALANSLRPVP